MENVRTDIFREIIMLEVGKKAPAFTLLDQYEKKRTLKESFGFFIFHATLATLVVTILKSLGV